MTKTPLAANLALAVGLLLPACGPQDQGGLGLELSFSTLEQAQTASGLPADLVGLQVDVFEAGLPNGDALASTGCIGLSASADEREGVSLDVIAGIHRVIMVSGYANTTCTGEAGWLGIAWDITVIDGKEQTVAIYVTRQGLRLNPIRDHMPRGRAFATATTLSNRKVLIAGGFDSIDLSGQNPTLVAACDALIYDPGSATIEKVLPLGACRGLHQALPLADGTVLLLGGSQQAVFDPDTATRPLVRPVIGSLLSNAEVYDPESGTFTALSSVDVLRRADAAGAVVGEGLVVLMGGRTTQLRSNEVVVGSGSGSSWSFQEAGAGLRVARSGARALALSDGVLVAGGNLPGQADLELIDTATYVSQELMPAGQAGDLGLSGHSLSPRMGNGFLLAGGAANSPGSVPSNEAFEGNLNAGEVTLTPRNLTSPRAHHAALRIFEAIAGGQVRIVLVGGLNAELESNQTAEILVTGQNGQALTDPLTIGAVGPAITGLSDGSILMIGGLNVDAGGSLSLSTDGQLLTP